MKAGMVGKEEWEGKSWQMYEYSTYCTMVPGLQLAGGLKKLSRSEKILGVGLDFKIRICPAHPRSDVGLEKLQALCEAYVKSIKRDHNKIYIWSLKSRRCICAASTEHKEISMNDESIDAENRANEITD